MPPYVPLHPVSSRALVQRPRGHKLRQLRGSALPAVQAVRQGLQFSYAVTYTRGRTGGSATPHPPPEQAEPEAESPGSPDSSPSSPRLIRGPIHRAPAVGMKKRGISPDSPGRCSARELPAVNAVNRASGALPASPDGRKGPAPGASGNKAPAG